MIREETPLQAAKRLGLPYVRLVIDRRHLKTGGGKIEIDGPVTVRLADTARALLQDMLEDGAK